MLDFLFLLIFGWLFVKAICISFKLAWGVAKIVGVILLVLVAPAVILCMAFAEGVLFLIPVFLVMAAFGVLRYC